MSTGMQQVNQSRQFNDYPCRNFTGDRILRDCVLEYIEIHNLYDIKEIFVSHWAETFKCRTENGNPVILRWVATSLRNNPSISTAMSDSFPREVPTVINYDLMRGITLYEDYIKEEGGPPEILSRGEIISKYADIQVRFMENSDALAFVRRTYAGDILYSIYEMLESPHLDQSGNIFSVIGEERRRVYVKLFNRFSKVFWGIARKVDSMPATINHCDIRPEIGYRNNFGEVALSDWESSIYSAPGWSLHQPLSDVKNIASLLEMTIGAKNSEATILDMMVITQYCKPWVDSKKFEVEEIRMLIIYGSIFGVLKQIVDLSRFNFNGSRMSSSILALMVLRLNSVFEMIIGNKNN